jgi:hypothetical protein
MLQTESILSPKEIQLCLMLQCLIAELAILIEQIQLLEKVSKTVSK